MLDSPGVNDLRLRFLDTALPDLALGPGTHPVHADAAGRPMPAGDGPVLLNLQRDRRGLWLLVEPAAQAVHLNGRPLRRIAQLRPGDRLHVAGHALQVLAKADAAPPGVFAGSPPASAARLVLRGLGGSQHGRAFPLADDLSVGGAGADIQLEGVAGSTVLAQVRAREGQVLAQAVDADMPLLVNGQALAAASLQPGDQLLIGGQRLLLEAPAATLVPPLAAAPASTRIPSVADLPAARPRRVPWLLIAAILLGGALAGLLLLGG